METLNKRLMDTFQNIQYNSYTPLGIKQLFEKWAEEIKKIAIEFANYCNSSGDCSELFDKFIEEYYV